MYGMCVCVPDCIAKPSSLMLYEGEILLLQTQKPRRHFGTYMDPHGM